MIYELRIYQCIPGKLPALLKRFETKTLDIWKKHGIRPTGFWTVLIGDGNNDLHYLLAWESLAEREQKWNAFQADPDGTRRATRARRTACSSPTSRPRCCGRRRSRRSARAGAAHGRAASTISCMRCAISMRRPSSIGALGFTVGARNRHPPAWGTQNHIVQLPGVFIELLGLATPSESRRTRADILFVRRVQPRFPGARRGAFDAGAGGPRRAGRAKHSAPPASAISSCYEFEREAKRPDGTAVKVAFSLAFAARSEGARRRLLHLPAPHPGELLESGIPESMPTRRPAVAGVVLVAERPERPSDLSVSLHRPARSPGDIGRHHHQDAARRNPGHEPGRVPRPFRHRAAGRGATARGLRRCALRCATSTLRRANRCEPLTDARCWAASSSVPMPRWARRWYSNGFER